jgi:hypothetical protein
VHLNPKTWNFFLRIINLNLRGIGVSLEGRIGTTPKSAIDFDMIYFEPLFVGRVDLKFKYKRI